MSRVLMRMPTRSLKGKKYAVKSQDRPPKYGASGEK